jgi:hypothetical protein
MEANKKSGYSIWFYTLGALASAGIIGSAYYIFTLFQAEEVLEEENQDKINVMHEKMRENSKKGKAEIDVDIAMQIMSITDKIAQESMQKNYADLDNERREALKNGYDQEFEEYCMKYLEIKQIEYSRAGRLVLAQFPGYTEEDLQRVFQTADPRVMEQLQNQQQFEKTELKEPVIEVPKVKEIYKSYGDIFIKEMHKLNALMRNDNSQKNDPQFEQLLMFKMMATKLKVEDLVYIKYSVTEADIKSLLVHHNLLNDPDIMAVNNQLMQMHQQLDMPMEP